MIGGESLFLGRKGDRVLEDVVSWAIAFWCVDLAIVFLGSDWAIGFFVVSG
jgi:hypothetical protein